jgi:hypothetical protein
MAKQEQNYKSAVKNLLDSVDRIADEMLAGKTVQYGKDAVKVVLLDYLEGMLSDNYHDDPNWYAEIIEDTLAEQQKGKEIE